MNTFQKRSAMVVYCCLIILFFFAYPCTLSSCSGRSPNLPEKQINEISTFVFPDTGYMPPSGAKYKEIRSVNKSKPPVIIDIVGNLENKKLIKISDFASSIRYIFLQQPPDLKFTKIYGIASDDKYIFVNALEGLFCFSTDGVYLYTICVNQIEFINGFSRITDGVLNNVDLLNGTLIFRTYNWPSIETGVTDIRLNVFDIKELEAKMLFDVKNSELKNLNPQPKYQRQMDPKKDAGGSSRYLLMDDLSLLISNSLTHVAVYGDTLCKFNDYDIFTLPHGANSYVHVSSSIYRINGNIMLQKAHNDTVFRVISPNRLEAAYVMRWDKYKPDINQHVAGSALEGKFVLGSWIETLRFIFIHYTEGRDYPSRRREGKVKDHWAIYDKTAKTLTHHITSSGQSTNPTPIPPMFENNIEPIGMPFYPQGINHKDEMYMSFSKEQLKNYIASGKFQNDKLQAIYKNMPDDGFCLMIVK